ncbi:putative membrane protein (plasmid) [Candidatus Protochlamydia naegleriophila]|uniref:Putative membrane protein n=1 Tax=Candidatus Protochlamydia naegleriophila TaxID=389348 RepID=A0A0U5CST2_9BACT|nr:hypothetical protein [Candidatus Protochlamydia naegleriophila]CUI18124.1 putative membrane protein [Candidatus Protochlamydia naegleriophila]
MHTSLIIFPFFILLSLLYGIYAQKLPSFTVDEIKPFLDQIDAKHEKRVRRIWLISFCLAIVLTVVNTLTGLMELTLRSQTFNIFLYPLIIFLAVTPGPWIIYHCAYKKKGTAWLLVVIFSKTIVLVVSIFKILGQAALLDSLDWLNIALPFSIDAFFWVSCIKLYRVNSKIEYQIVLALKHKYGTDANGFCL